MSSLTTNHLDQEVDDPCKFLEVVIETDNDLPNQRKKEVFKNELPNIKNDTRFNSELEVTITKLPQAKRNGANQIKQEPYSNGKAIKQELSNEYKIKQELNAEFDVDPGKISNICV